MTIKRLYPSSDVDMLTTCDVIIDHAILKEGELIVRRPNWVAPYFVNIKTRIANAMATNLGHTPKSGQKQKTLALVGKYGELEEMITSLHLDIDDLLDDVVDLALQTRAFDELGFTAHYKGVKDGNQQAMVDFLFTFKNGLTPTLRTDLMAKHVSAALLDGVQGQAVDFSTLNVQQEGLKQSSKEVTDADIAIFNGIYKDVIKICKLAQDLYKRDRAKSDEFSYAKINRALHGQGTGGNTPPAEGGGGGAPA
ncbi:MAG: hypothetical protein NTX03_13660 [Bacteroidetes bacterium]|nr:hypothetical protein [Bacteroidota bacterium]